MLINLSNHPSADWPEEQKAAASVYGHIADLPFPAVDAERDETYIGQLVDEYEQKADALANGASYTVHIMGEMTFTFRFVSKMKEKNIQCVASTTARLVDILPDGSKRAQFQFKRFRTYI